MLETLIVKLSHEIPHDVSLVQTLSLERRMRILKYKNELDKKRCLIAELLIRKLASEKLNISREQIKISYNPYGKPYIDNVRHFRFNLSHSGDYVIIAISKHNVGVDIEQIKTANLAIARRFFTSNEFHYINSFHTTDQQNEGFYQLWTLKEAYMKAIGKGLNVPLNSFELNIENNISVKDSHGKKPFSFYSTKFDMYALSICYRDKKIDTPFRFIHEAELYDEYYQH